MSETTDYSNEEIANAIMHSYTGEIDENNLDTKDIYTKIGYCTLSSEIKWNH